ncbi:hypothetical protein AAY473_031653, partial [Plecturocebus cupreus]
MPLCTLLNVGCRCVLHYVYANTSKKSGLAWWLTPVIPTLWKAKAGGSPERGQHGETPSLLKIQRSAEHDGTCLKSQLLGKLKHKNRLNPGGRGC